MGNIVLLDELTINQIAAGEVIERPASVIKEMVENSIDAGAKNITVEIKNGGISFIRITDDGKGIAKDDVELAFERHATSKIRSAGDLSTVKSMGFRGEALASIAAIANIELVSKTEFDDIGTRIVVEGGDVLSLDEIGCTQGTTITVRNLFFNTPVRYKFLKKDFTESGYIEDVITRIALIHPEIAIKFINTGKTVLRTNGSGNLNNVIYSIFGKEVASNIMTVNYDYDDITIKGVVGKTNIARSNRSNQIFFVNKRYIKDKTLSSAVDQAFKGMLPMGKFAFLVLDIEMLPTKVDVNVHPAKLEVRFAEENIIFKAMYHAIKDTLLKEGLMSDREKIQEINEAAKDAFKINDVEKSVEKTYTIENKEILASATKSAFDFIPNRTNSVLENSKVMTNQKVFDDLKKLQEDLRKEVEQNPNLQLTDKYKEMEQKYNEIIKPAVETQKEETKMQSIEEPKPEIEIPQIEEQELEIETPLIEEEIKEETIIPILFENSKENIEQDTSNEKQESEDLKNELQINNKEQENLEISKDVQITENEPKQQATLQNENEKNLSFEEMYKQLFGKEPYGGRKQPETENKKVEGNFYTIETKIEDSNISMFEGDSKYQKLNYKFIGISFDKYIILEIENELYIIDQNLAHERIIYEKVKKNFYEEGEKVSQLLLLPDIITLSHKEMDIAKDNFSLFRQSGFIIEEFGENTIKLSGVPEVCIDLDTNELLKETLDQINTVARTAKTEKEEKFISAVARKAAEKASLRLIPEEIDSLISSLLELPNPFTCLGGKPIAIKMSKYEIERKFARK